MDHVRVLEGPKRRAAAALVPDEPQFTIAHHVLRAGDGTVWAAPGVLVVAWDHLPREVGVFGEAEQVWEALKGIDGWDTALCAARADAEALASTIPRPTRLYDDINYVFRGPVPDEPSGDVRLLGSGDEHLLAAMPEIMHLAPDDWIEPLLRDGLVVASFADGTVASRAVVVAFTDRYADIGIHTAEAHHGQGHATAASAALVRLVLACGLTPVWATGEDNIASQRLAARLGFEEIARLTYVVLD